MREIKFRGKRINNGEWDYGYLVNSGHQVNPYVEFWWIAKNRYDFGTVFDERSCDDTFIWHRVDPDTIGQYTGLKDKNGVEIYEGDFVKWDDGASVDEIRFGRIGYDSGVGYTGFVGVDTYWGEEWSKEKDGRIEFYTCARGVEDKHLKVIGNKWDNPELLKRR